MEQITWNSPEIKEHFRGTKNLAEVTQVIEKDLWARGFVVCEVWVNEMYLNEQDETRLQSTEVSEIQKIVVKYEDPKRLTLDTISSLIVYIPQLSRLCVEISEDLQAQRKAEATTKLKQAIDGCLWLTTALEVLKRQDCVRDLDLTQWNLIEVQFANAIKELLIGLEGPDFVLVGDVLEYELSTSLDTWLGILKNLLSAINP